MPFPSGLLTSVAGPVAPLTGLSAVTGWSADVPALVVVSVVSAAYLLAVRRAGTRGEPWSATASAWFLIGGMGSLLLVTCSFLGTYSRVLFWPLAVQDVLFVTLVPVGMTLGRPLALWRTVCPRRDTRLRLPSALRSLFGFPLTGSVLAVVLLLLVYTTGWDQARLEHPALLALTRLLLLGAGCSFLWPLIGVDDGTGHTSYPLRALIAFVDGLLDALPGLAVLGTGHVIAAGYYARVARTWGPTLPEAQKTGGTAMIVLSEIVGLPALLALLVAWVRRDAQQARDIDAALDVIDAAEIAACGATGPEGDVLHRPWWEVDPGPLADRAARYERRPDG